MKKSICLTLVAFLAANPLQLLAEEPVFMSLTRRSTPISKLPTNISTLSSDEIEKSGATTLSDVLDLIPSVDVSRSGSLGSLSTVRMRGVPSSNQVQIVIDDQPLGGVSVQNIDAGLIPVDNIERIEVVRGGASSLYGPNTIGGVIHIFTKRQSEDPSSLSLGFEGRSHKTEIYNVQAGARSAKVDAFLTGQKFRTDGYQRNSDVENHSASGNVGVSFENGARVGVDVAYTDQEQGTASGTTTPFDQWDGERERITPNTPTNRIDKSSRKERIKLSLPIHKVLVQTVGYHSNEDLTSRSAPGSNPFSDIDNTILGNDTRFIFENGFLGGVSYERNERESLGQIPRHVTNLGFYVQDQISLGKFELFPSLRLDQHGTTGNEYNPRLAVVFLPTDNWKVSANAGRSTRAPTLVDLFIVLQTPGFPAFDFFGNPNLRPEVAWTYDLGTEVKAGPFGVNVTGFFTRIRDRMIAVDSDNNGFVDTVQNISKAELSGIETVLDLKTGPLTQNANYTFQRARGNTTTSADFVPLRFTPKHLFNYQAVLEICKGVSLVNSIQYVSRQYQFDGETGIRLPSYTLWNARLEKNMKWAKVFVAVKNITDKLYAESITFGTPVPQPARTYAAGVQVKLGKQ